MFKIGDLVKCINDDNTALVTKNKEYQVLDSDNKFTSVRDDYGFINEMYNWRFELIKVPKFVSQYPNEIGFND